MQISATLSYLLYAASVAIAAPIEKRAYTGGATANDVKNGVCAPVTLIFARGSTESGNMGSSVGPALAKALIAQLGASGVAVQGVDYEATIASNAQMGAGGGPVMTQLAQQALKACPNTKIAIAGYSQGGSVVHNAMKTLSASSVSSAVLYGDPMYKQGSVGSLPASKVKEFCASGDGVCESGTFSISAAHMSYTSNGDAKSGASFIAQNAGSSGGAAAATPVGSDSSSTSTGTGATGTGSTTGTSGGLGGLSGLMGGGTGTSSGLGSFGSLGTSTSGATGTDGTATGASGLSGLGSFGSGSTTSSGLGSLGSGASIGSSTSSGLGSLSSVGSGSTGTSSGLSGFSSLFGKKTA